MTDDEVSAYLHRFDEQTVSVRFVDEGADEELQEIWTGHFVEPDWDDEWPAKQLIAAVRTEEYPPPHTLSVRRGYVDWGASGATEALVLAVAAGALGTLVPTCSGCL